MNKKEKKNNEKFNNLKIKADNIQEKILEIDQKEDLNNEQNSDIKDYYKSELAHKRNKKYPWYRPLAILNNFFSKRSSKQKYKNIIFDKQNKQNEKKKLQAKLEKIIKEIKKLDKNFSLDKPLQDKKNDSNEKSSIEANLDNNQEQIINTQPILNKNIVKDQENKKELEKKLTTEEKKDKDKQTNEKEKKEQETVLENLEKELEEALEK